MNDQLAGRPTGREALLLVASLVLMAVSTQLDWTAVSSSCANTAVTRGFGESVDAEPWNWLFFLGAVAGIGSTLVRPRISALVAGIGAIVMTLSLVRLTMLLTEPFEAIRPGAPGARPVGVLCDLDLVVGFWVGLVALLCLVVAVALRVRRDMVSRA